MNDPTDGRARPRGTSLADQDEAQLGGPASILVRQRRDHERLDRLLHELEDSSGAAQKRVLIRICRPVFPHAFAEEAVLWPVIRRVLPDGQALTLQVEEEHQEVNELVTRLEGDDLGPSERHQALDRLVEALREDVRDEEDALLPGLQQRLSVHQLRRLGIVGSAVRHAAPTRPHPVVARRPPGNAFAALPLTVLDNLRDLCEVAADRSPRAAPALENTSRALARAAGRIERLEIMRFSDHRHLLDEEFGSGIRYDALPGKKACRIHIDRLSGDVLDTDAHGDFMAWFISTEKFRPLTQQIKSLLEAN